MHEVARAEVHQTKRRTTVELDDCLLDEAVLLTGARTKRAAIEIALADLVRRRKVAELANLAGKVPMRLTHRDLRVMRGGR